MSPPSFPSRTADKAKAWSAGFALALALGAASAPASAQTFTFSGDLSDSRVVTLTDNGGQSTFDGYAGRYKGQLGSGPVSNIFCVDISHEIQPGDTYAANTQYNITSAAGAFGGGYHAGGLASALTDGDIAGVTLTQANQRAGEVAYLADNYLNATTFTGASGSTNATDNFAALSLSVWDIVQDGGGGLTSGQVRTGAGDASAYGGLVGYYEALAAGHTNYTSTTAAWIQAPEPTLGQHFQDYVYEKPAPSSAPQAVPEPGLPAVLSCLALVAGGFWLRRRRAVAR